MTPRKQTKTAVPSAAREFPPEATKHPSFFPLNNVAVICLIIVFSCLGMYFRSLSYDYSYNDDDVMILDNAAFLHNLSNIPQAIVSDAWFKHQQIELYRPLQNVTFMLDAALGKDIIFSTHRTNLILHILCCLAVFFLLQLFRFDRKYALFGALIYAVHFLFLHAVIWIPARGDLLLTLNALLTTITFLLILRSGKWYHYVLNVLAFGLALFSKESAIMLPLIFVVYLILFSRKTLFTKEKGLLGIFYLLKHLDLPARHIELISTFAFVANYYARDCR